MTNEDRLLYEDLETVCKFARNEIRKTQWWEFFKQKIYRDILRRFQGAMYKLEKKYG